MNNVKFKFRLISDNFVNEDGFAFDDFKIIADGQGLSVGARLHSKFNLYPNPANNYVTVENSEEIS